MERRLAAILAAGVVGYSRLIREDEAGTLAAAHDLVEVDGGLGEVRLGLGVAPAVRISLGGVGKRQAEREQGADCCRPLATLMARAVITELSRAMAAMANHKRVRGASASSCAAANEK